MISNSKKLELKVWEISPNWYIKRIPGDMEFEYNRMDDNDETKKYSFEFDDFEITNNLLDALNVHDLENRYSKKKHGLRLVSILTKDLNRLGIKLVSKEIIIKG